MPKSEIAKAKQTGKRRTLPNGRSAGQAEHWTKMLRSTMEEPAWAALSPTAQAAYPWLKLEWRGPKANNNGRLRLSVRQLADRLGVTPNTAGAALHDLQAKGFLIVTERAVLGIDGEAKGPAFELTELALPTSVDPSGRRLYRDWAPGHDFKVIKARANNPSGVRSKTKAHLKNLDGTVVVFETKERGAS